ncbi:MULTISPECIES: DegV family protein [Luteimonas]|jgi:DegV family protein with EDD domain|uniref:DegV family protein n=1 Tax=Luteimonas TaxID=83614 RepID=UPI000C7BF544|nr:MULTISPECIES: DegV family protein [Luteimonas]
MRIGIVVDSACDLPPDWLEANNVVLLPVTVRIGETQFVDLRDERATLDFVDAHVAERGHTAETAAFPSDKIKALFLERLVIDYDYVFCITVTRNRSQIHDNATHASFAILNEYRPIRTQAGHTTPFALRIVDTQQVFAGQGLLPVEAVRLRDAGATAPEIRSRLEFLAERSYAYMVPRDLGYLRARIKHRGDKSVSLLAAMIGGALDIKPILHCHRGDTGPVGKIRGFAPAAEKLLGFVAERVRAGLLTPTLCLSYGGELDELRRLPGYDALVAECEAHNVERFETVMSLTGMVNVGAGSLTVGFAAPPHAFS